MWAETIQCVHEFNDNDALHQAAWYDVFIITVINHRLQRDEWFRGTSRSRDNKQWWTQVWRHQVRNICSAFNGRVRACEKLRLQSPLTSSDEDDETRGSKLFQMRSAASAIERSAVVEWFDRGMTGASLFADRSRYVSHRYESKSDWIGDRALLNATPAYSPHVAVINVECWYPDMEFVYKQ